MTLVKRWQILKSKFFDTNKPTQYNCYIDYTYKGLGLSLDVSVKSFKTSATSGEVKDYIIKNKLVVITDLDTRKYLIYKWDVFKKYEGLDILIDFIKMYYNDDGFYNQMIKELNRFSYNLIQHNEFYIYHKTRRVKNESFR